MNPSEFSAALARGNEALARDSKRKTWTAKLRRAISRYVNARINDSWKGGGDPESIPSIENELRLARRALNKLLRDCV